MNFDSNDPQLTAYVLGELPEDERRQIERRLENDAEARATVEEIRTAAEWLSDEMESEPIPALLGQEREAEILRQAAQPTQRPTRINRVWIGVAAALLLALPAAYLATFGIKRFGVNPIEIARTTDGLAERESPEALNEAFPPDGPAQTASKTPAPTTAADGQTRDALSGHKPIPARSEGEAQVVDLPLNGRNANPALLTPSTGISSPTKPQAPRKAPVRVNSTASITAPPPALDGILDVQVRDESGGVIPGATLSLVPAAGQKDKIVAVTNDSGSSRFRNLTPGEWSIKANLAGFKTFDKKVEIPRGEVKKLVAVLEVGSISETVIVTGQAPAIATEAAMIGGSPARSRAKGSVQSPGLFFLTPGQATGNQKVSREVDRFLSKQDTGFNTENYAHFKDNPFQETSRQPLSTFSIDVDTASYANLRRFLNDGMQPPPDAVRIEEMINYFHYDYAGPHGEDPFAVHLETAEAPWDPEHLLLRVGLKGREVPAEERPDANLVFLIDVSGSMSSPDKLPLLKRGMRVLVDHLSEHDRVAIAVYAGAAGLVLPSTSCERKGLIFDALERLEAGGSTNGAAGIRLAYQTARDHFIKGGINRVILATDGDFNIGVSSQGDLVRMIEKHRQSGVFLSVLGFGSGNLQDAKMESLADKGNGNYAYIDSLSEARKVLVEEMGGTLMTIAKDVKIQIEFNPEVIGAYRLIGYENRRLAAEDFNDDTKDAGEIGAGHTVTALYELIPAGLESRDTRSVDPLKYQEARMQTRQALSDEWLTVKLRYKRPEQDASRLIEVPLQGRDQSFHRASKDLRWAAAVAAFGMLLRDSQFKGSADWDSVAEWASDAQGHDPSGLRREMLTLLKASRNRAVKK